MFEKWQIFLFDFDGTLVNSEKLQHQAYLQVAQEYGIPFAPDFATYAKLAHFSDHAVKDAICSLAPDVDWSAFYREKKRIYLEIVRDASLELMEGVEPLLIELSKRKVITCVVTHSAKDQTLSFCKKLPVLQTIQHWITREDYNHPKPAPDSYQKAIEILKTDPKQKVVGIEDTPRGLQALLAVDADPILVSKEMDPELIFSLQKQGSKSFTYLSSLTQLISLL